MASLLLGACSVHKLDIQQGTVMEPEMLEGLKVGLDKRQVRFIMGTPSIDDPFHHNRWDYYYSLKQDRRPPVRQRITLHFEGERLTAIERFDLEPEQATALSAGQPSAD